MTVKPSFLAAWGLIAALLTAVSSHVSARPGIEIQSVTSPGGITAWLVEDDTIPLIAMNFSFSGGASVDSDDKAGLANFLSGMLDEGAGDLDSEAFQRRIDELSVRMSFRAQRDHFTGSLQTLSQTRDEAFGLLRLALTAPRFDAEPLQRVRGQILLGILQDNEDPDHIANQAWMRAMFADHPYGRPVEGTAETVNAIQAVDLEALRQRLFARQRLRIAVVGDIDAETLKRLLDDTFGALPATSGVAEVAEATPVPGPRIDVIERNIPQSVIRFGHGGIKRDDPDFIPAFMVNSILGGGGFGSRLMQEVREKRGLVYSVFSSLQPMRRAGLVFGGAATMNERAAETVAVVREELERMAVEGPTEEELDEAKTYLTGSYPLNFDSNSKIANQLLAIQEDELGIDYVNRRNGLIEAVRLEDVKRVARRLIDADGLVITVVGKPEGITSTGQ
ncbi:MAG TPA: pitrilysin family protein [Aestuariivirgaceae bacterium]|nr:pitrilysin family protein [Aestuariivirgaceae bacterium]